VLEAPAAGPVCEPCWLGVRPFSPPLCEACGDPLPSLGGGARCPSCRRGDRPVARARAIGRYDHQLRDIIHALKYEQRRSLAAQLGAMMRAHGAPVLDGADAAVPVPLHWLRRYQRGFNQSAILADGLGLPVWHALRRRRRTRSQVELPAEARHANVDGAFALAWRYRNGAWHHFSGWRPTGSEPLSGSVLVLVDDVSTTGATLDACARVLRAAGATEVRALTAARVVSPRR